MYEFCKPENLVRFQTGPYMEHIDDSETIFIYQTLEQYLAEHPINWDEYEKYLNDAMGA